MQLIVGSKILMEKDIFLFHNLAKLDKRFTKTNIQREYKYS